MATAKTSPAPRTRTPRAPVTPANTPHHPDAPKKTEAEAEAVPESIAPSPNITVILAGKPFDIFMSFGLLRELTEITGGFESINEAFLNQAVMIEFLSVLLTPREKNGRPIPTEVDGQLQIVWYDSQYAEIDEDDRERLLQWAYGHVLNFFLKRVLTLKKTFTSAVPELEHLTSSASGLQALALKMRSAGPTA